MIVWETQPLGQKSDGQLARELGVDQSTVTKARQRLGVEAFQTRPAINWRRCGLGQRSDATIAEEIGVSRETVRRNRVQRGIPSIKGPPCVAWELQPLGKMQDKAVAHKLGVSENAVKQARVRRGIAGFTQKPVWDRGLLGKMPDSTIARQFGVSKTAVGAERKRQGIPRADLLCLTTEDEPANQEEALIDLYWHEHGTPHEFQFPIGPYVADWVINGNTVVEYAGSINHPIYGEAYQNRLQEKIAFYKEQGWEVLVLTPADLSAYDTGHPPKFRQRGQCTGCGRHFGSREGLRGGHVRRATATLCDVCWRRTR